MTRWFHLLRTAAIMAFVTAAFLEVGLRMASGAGLLPAPERPTEALAFYEDANPAFGVWHPPNASFRAQTACFDVVYRSNSYGARDRERERRSGERRAVVLGDSFVEGIGVELEDRVTEQLERLTGREHLNFGAAGNFSSTQEWLQYRTLVANFDHDQVVVFHLPNNDFIENDRRIFYYPRRYRPYLERDSGGEFQVIYPVTLEEARLAQEALLRFNRLYNAVYLVRLYELVKIQMRARAAEAALGRSSPGYGYIGYDDYREEDMTTLQYGYRELARLAGERRVLLVSIPRYQELKLQADTGHAFRLPGELATFADTIPNLTYVDLLPAFVADRQSTGRSIEAYFHTCDGHWSSLGHRVAAEAIAPHLAE